MSHTTLPEGYIPHDGGVCPIDKQTRVQVIVQTSTGLGLSVISKAEMHVWEESFHAEGIGAVLGYHIPPEDKLT